MFLNANIRKEYDQNPFFSRLNYLFLAKIYFLSIKKKISGKEFLESNSLFERNFVQASIFSTKSFLQPGIFSVENFFDLNFFWPNTFYLIIFFKQKIIFQPKHCFNQNIFGTKKIF